MTPVAIEETVVAVVGLGYVGLPLAVAFGRTFRTIGFDVSQAKIEDYRKGSDPTGEVGAEHLKAATRLEFTDRPESLGRAGVIIIAVPTPIDSARQPDFGPLLAACRFAGAHMARGTTVIFESTVYPGATEEVCIPSLEKASGKRWKEDFSVGYSPERINPGDKKHTLESIVKVVAGDSPQSVEFIARLYGAVVKAGIHRASSIKVAEAAKVAENTQRDLNIAFMNELAIICHRAGIDTAEVLAAARTKWNFLDFRPGLVGGHCIGVDPYYLTHKAEQLGLHPQVILAGRRINDGMGKYIAEQTVKCLVEGGAAFVRSTAVVLGLTFKEDCRDIRNSKVVDVIRELGSYGIETAIHDPLADPDAARREYGLTLSRWEDLPVADCLVLAVAHEEYRRLGLDELLAKVRPGGWVIDVKSALDREHIEERGRRVWRL